MCIKRVYRKRSNVEWYDVNKGEALKSALKTIII